MSVHLRGFHHKMDSPTDSGHSGAQQRSVVNHHSHGGHQHFDVLSKQDDSTERNKTDVEMYSAHRQHQLPNQLHQTTNNSELWLQVQPTDNGEQEVMDNEDEEVSATDSHPTTPTSALKSPNSLILTPDPETRSIKTNKTDTEVIISAADVRGESVSLRTHLYSMWYLVVVVLAPVLLLPVILSVDQQHQKAARCGYTLAIMAVYWMSECLPIAVTSLLPVVMLPTLGILSAKTVTAAYFNDTSMLFMAGFTGAIAIETWGVHKRVALLVLRVTGSEPRCLLLGMTLVTWFLSMWISNTATTAMMMTIVHALLEQFREFKDVQTLAPASAISPSHKTSVRQTREYDVEMELQQRKRKSEAELSRLAKALSLTVAYAANIGGVASLTGTGPNLVFFAAAQKVFEDVGLRSPVSFSTWMVYGLPLSLLLVIIMWLWMVLVFLRCKGNCSCCRWATTSDNQQVQKVNARIRDEYLKLGPVTYAQGSVIVSFVTLILAWITRDLGGVGGWNSWFPGGYVSDSTPSLLFGILMFILPSSFPSSVIRRCDTAASYQGIRPLLTWPQIHTKMPWSLYLLLGGGYALARAATDSGLSAWIGSQLLVFRELNHWAILLIVCYIITFLTEVTSNTAIATLMMPILSEMAISLQLNPLFLMFPAAITTSFAFMLPVATPPNAIVFSHGTVRVVDMVTSGLFLNCVSVPILLFATATWGNAFFQFDHMPAEFARNVTGVLSHS